VNRKTDVIIVFGSDGKAQVDGLQRGKYSTKGKSVTFSMN